MPRTQYPRVDKEEDIDEEKEDLVCVPTGVETVEGE